VFLFVRVFECRYCCFVDLKAQSFGRGGNEKREKNFKESIV